MLSLKAVIRNYPPFINKQGKVNIKIRFRHNNSYIYFSTEYFIEPGQFSIKEGLLNDRHPDYENWNYQLRGLILEIEGKLLHLGRQRDYMTKGALIRYLKSKTRGTNFLKYLEDYIEVLKKTGREGTSYLYRATYKHLKRFKSYGVLEFKDVNVYFLNKFEDFLRTKRFMVNSIANIMSAIRAVYNRAIDEEIIGLENYPFRRYSIKQENTIKRNLSVNEMRKIMQIELDQGLSVYRDIFILSFYLMGINMADLLQLKEIDNGRIVYKRAKTGKIYSVKVYPEAQKIINRYSGKKYLLKFIEETSKYEFFKNRLNKYLKHIAGACNISKPISSYYARHSWATIASNLDIPKDVIAQALGHKSTITDIYIDFDIKRVDIANRKIIDVITGS